MYTWHVNKYSSFKYKYKYKYPSLKYEYEYKYSGLKYKYKYQVLHVWPFLIWPCFLLSLH